jgi:GPH family glycoside/pentoside/hexuronide:cation symporter
LIVIYNPPAMDDTTLKFLYLLMSYLALTTAMTVIGVPHIALGGDLSFDRNERTEIFGYRRLFTTAGLLVGTMLPALVLLTIGAESDPTGVARSRSITSVVLALPILLTAWITLRTTKGLDRAAPTSTKEHASTGHRLLSLLRSQLGALRNVVFLPLLLAFMVAGIGRALNASIALYYYEYRLGMSEPDTVLYVLLPFFIAILASVPLWVLVSRRAGKKWPAFWGILGLGILITVAYPVLPPDRLVWPLAVAVVGGFMAGAIILYESLVADVVDYDELRTGRNREGLYFGVWKMATKLSRAVGIAVAGLLLEVIGFQEGAAMQTEAVARNLGILFGPGVGAFFLLGTLLFAFMPLTDARHRRVQALLLRRRRWREAT